MPLVILDYIEMAPAPPVLQGEALEYDAVFLLNPGGA